MDLCAVVSTSVRAWFLHVHPQLSEILGLQQPCCLFLVFESLFLAASVGEEMASVASTGHVPTCHRTNLSVR